MIHNALVNYNQEVKEGKFPLPENCAYKVADADKEKLMQLLDKVSQTAGVNSEVVEGEVTKLY